MHRLTLDQKIENYEELLNSKLTKISKLETEIRNIQRKVEKLKLSKDKTNSVSGFGTSSIETSNIFQ